MDDHNILRLDCSEWSYDWHMNVNLYIFLPCPIGRLRKLLELCDRAQSRKAPEQLLAVCDDIRLGLDERLAELKRKIAADPDTEAAAERIFTTERLRQIKKDREAIEKWQAKKGEEAIEKWKETRHV